LVNTYTSPINNDKSQFDIFSTLQTDALITNNPYLNRYTGGPGNSNNPQSWKQTIFITSPSNNLSFATGEDISVLSTQKDLGATNQYLQFDPNFSSWGTVQTL